MAVAWTKNKTQRASVADPNVYGPPGSRRYRTVNDENSRIRIHLSKARIRGIRNTSESVIPDHNLKFLAFPAPVLRIRIHVFLGLQDPDPDPLVRGMDPDPSIIMQK